MIVKNCHACSPPVVKVIRSWIAKKKCCFAESGAVWDDGVGAMSLRLVKLIECEKSGTERINV